MTFQSTKQYGHEIGLSACFRQWKAHSHCSKLHGYALAVKFVFACNELDETNWVVDFGSMKSLKGMLEDTFDHKLLVAEDDPQLQEILRLQSLGVADVVVVPACGCEMFADMIFQCAKIWLSDNGYTPRVWLVSVEVKEHGANSAIRSH